MFRMCIKCLDCLVCECPLLGAALQQHAGKVAVVELEVSLVVELEEGGAVGMLLLQVQVVDLGLGRRVPAVLAHVHLNTTSVQKQFSSSNIHYLRSPLFVVVLVSHPVNFEAVTLQ